MVSFAAITLLTVLPSASPPGAIGGTGFVENLGQWHDQVRYLAQGPGTDLWVTDSGLTLDFNQNGRGHVVRIDFAQGTVGRAAGRNALPGTVNYLVGDRSQWVTGAKGYAEAYVEGLAKGVDARYYFDNGAPRYDLVLRAGADPSALAMRYTGATNVRVGRDGALRYDTSLGTVTEKGLFAYQNLPSGARQIAASPVVSADGTVSYRLGAYDKSRPVVIDPVISWSTFVGGNGTDTATGVATDGSGNVYATGTRSNNNFPTTVGPYSVSNTSNAAWVTVYNSAGVRQWATAVGQGLNANAIALAGSQPVVVGTATASGLPAGTTAGFQASRDGQDDAFYFKLAANGSSIVTSSYIGGSQDEAGTSVSVDSDNTDRVYIGGYTESSMSFPDSGGSVYRSTSGGNRDGFVFAANLGNSGTNQRSACTFIGGSADDEVNGIAAIPSGDLLVSGRTASSTFPLSSGGSAFTGYGSKNTGQDGYVLRIQRTLQQSQLSWRRFFGTSGTDAGTSVAVSGTYLVVGGFVANTTVSPSLTGFQTTAQGGQDGLLFGVNLSSPGTVSYATRFGSSGTDSINGVAVDANGWPYVVGTLGGSVTGLTGSYGGGNDAFYARLNGTASAINWGRYLGGSGADAGNAVSLASSTVNLAGTTASSGFPTANAQQGTLGGSTDGFVTSISTAAGIDLTTASSSIVGNPGRKLQGTVTLDAIQATDAVVSLSSTDTTNAAVPASVTISAGSLSANFDITTQDVFYDAPATITATLGSASDSANITVTPPVVSSIVLDNNSVAGPGQITGTLYLASPAPADGQIVRRTLVEPDTTTSVNKVWATVVSTNNVAAGQSSIPITITGIPTSTTRTMQLFVAGAVRSANFSIVPPTVASLEITPSPVSGGKTLYVKAILNGKAPAGGTEVALTSSNAAVPLPATITVPEGAYSNRAVVVTVPVATDTSVDITAAANGQTPVTGSVTVKAPVVSQLVLSATTIAPGGRVYGYVKLTGPAPAGDLPYTASVPEASGVRFYQEPGVFSKTVSVPAGATYGPTPKWILQVPLTATSGSTFDVTVNLNGVPTSVTVTVS